MNKKLNPQEAITYNHQISERHKEYSSNCLTLEIDQQDNHFTVCFVVRVILYMQFAALCRVCCQWSVWVSLNLAESCDNDI